MEFEVLLSGRFFISQDVLQQAVDGDRVIVNPANGEVCTLDALGASVWDIMQDIQSFDEIRSIMVEAFDAEPERVEADLDVFFKALIDNQILRQ